MPYRAVRPRPRLRSSHSRSRATTSCRPRPGVGSLLDRFGPGAYARAAREAVVNDNGPVLSPFNGFLLHQGLETLSMRMERHSNTSLEIGAWLSEQPEVELVSYAGLPSSPLYDIAARDYGPSSNGLGARTSSVFGVTVRGGIDGARAFVNGLRIFTRMTGIGDTRSMIIHPRTSTYASFTPEINERLGITQGLLRLSVGLESPRNLITDLRAGLDRV